MAKKNKTNPQISLIVAMYNAEEYVTQCLESVLNQTFQDFEIILVDDCSTDKSYKIASEFIDKFDGKLKIFKTKKNNGFPGAPRNLALKEARGKYIMFLDSDDFLTETCFEEFFNVAEKTNADVVHAEKCYSYKDGETKIYTFQKEPFVTETTFEVEDIIERVIKFYSTRTLWWACNKMFRREFLNKFEIKFPNAITAWEDLVFTFACVLNAKIYVRTPIIGYYYRIRDSSLSHKPRAADEMTKNLIGSVAALEKYMDKSEELEKNFNVRFNFLNWYIQGRLDTICKGFYDNDKFVPPQIEIFCRKNIFANMQKDNISLTSYLFTMTTYLMRMVQENFQTINALKAEIENLKK